MRFIETTGQKVIQFISSLGDSVVFFFAITKHFTYLFQKPGLFARQVYQLGILSLPIILLSGLFIGMVLAFQGYVNLVKFGAEASVGTVTALALFRELSSVFTALLYAGRAGSSLTAEIGLMRATEQWSSYEMMAVDPYRYILLPRLMAGIIVVPILTILFSDIGILGSYYIAVEVLGLDGGGYWSQMQSSVVFYDDIFNGVIVKSIVFGLICNLVALREGLMGGATSSGIANSTTATVVKASLLILAADFLLTALLFR